MTHEKFVDLVAEMRERQRNYFNYRRPNDLTESKRLEKLVDKAIADFHDGSTSLFNQQGL